MDLQEADQLHAIYSSLAEVRISAPASTVWQHVIDIPTWIQDYHFEVGAGEPGTENSLWMLWADGAESAAGKVTVDPGDRTPDNALLLKTVAVIPERLWYGINPPRSFPDDGSIRSGVNLITLVDLGNETHVTAIRSQEALCVSRESRDSIRALWQQFQSIGQRRWTEMYLPRIKALSEDGR